MSYLSTVLATPGLVSVWELGETVGSFVDAAGSNDGTLVDGGGVAERGQASLLPNGEGKSLRLKAAGSTSVRIPFAADLLLAGPLTLECWLKVTNINTNMTFICHHQSGAVMYMPGGFPTAEGKVELDKNNNDFMCFTEDPQLVTDTVCHLAITMGADSDTCLVYINGRAVTTSVNPTAQSLAPPRLDWHLGGQFHNNNPNGTRFLDGWLQYAALYDEELDARTVAEHFAAGSSVEDELTAPVKIKVDGVVVEGQRWVKVGGKLVSA